MRLLISTSVGDEHALAVDMAMRARGHDVVRWFAADCPTRQTQSFRVGPGTPPVFTSRDDLGPSWGSNTIDVAWFRRHAPAGLTGAVPADRLAHVGATWTRFHQSFRELFPDTTAWVNDPERQLLAESKPAQLRVARQVGLAVPDTLITNDPDEARAFVAARPGQVLFKPLTLVERTVAGRTRVSRAVRVGLDQLRHDSAIRTAPSIFQEVIPVRRELRVTLMGAAAVCAAIRDRDDRVVLDWRSIARDRRCIEPCTLPEEVLRRCQAFMRAMGLSFATLDLVQHADGRYVFLESNPAGQFLWVEQANPDIPMLRTFCEYLESLDRSDPPVPSTSAGASALGSVLNTEAFHAHLADDARAHRTSRNANVLSESEPPAAAIT